MSGVALITFMPWHHIGSLYWWPSCNFFVLRDMLLSRCHVTMIFTLYQCAWYRRWIVFIQRKLICMKCLPFCIGFEIIVFEIMLSCIWFSRRFVLEYLNNLHREWLWFCCSKCLCKVCSWSVDKVINNFCLVSVSRKLFLA